MIFQEIPLRLKFPFFQIQFAIHSDINARDVSSAVKKDVKTAKSEKEKERARAGKGAEVQALPNQDDVKQILSIIKISRSVAK